MKYEQSNELRGMNLLMMSKGTLLRPPPHPKPKKPKNPKPAQKNKIIKYVPLHAPFPVRWQKHGEIR